MSEEAEQQDPEQQQEEEQQEPKIILKQEQIAEGLSQVSKTHGNTLFAFGNFKLIANYRWFIIRIR